MNVQVVYDGTDITTKVISYTREQQICTGVGNASFDMDNSLAVSPELYKNVVLYEGGIKKGTYVVSSINKNIPNDTISLICQDNSKRLQDYFIAETVTVTDPTYCRYWIEKYLDEAGVNYDFNGVGNGSLISNNTQFGLTDAMSAITQLLQMSGWYLYFDANGTAQIGHFEFDVDSSDVNLDKDDIIDLSSVNHDRMFRNRVVVYGGGDPTNFTWVSAEIDRTGTYQNEYDGADTRTVVIANGNLPDNAAAEELATVAIEEMTRENLEVTTNLHGYRDIVIGDRAFVTYKDFTVLGTVTTIGSRLDSGGLITHVVINERCPRLFTYFNYGGYVYVGTKGNGIWRKHLKYDHTWTNYSEGLIDLNIKDLYITNGLMTCVTDSGYLYDRNPSLTAWSRVNATFEDEETSGTLTQNDVIFNACTIDHMTNSIYGVASLSGFVINNPNPAYRPRSWILEKTGSVINTNQLLYGDNSQIYSLDVDHDGQFPYITALYGDSISFPNYSVSRNGAASPIISNLLTSTEYNTLWYIKQGYDIRVGPKVATAPASYQNYIYSLYTNIDAFDRLLRYSPSTGIGSTVTISSPGIDLYRFYTGAVDENRCIVYGNNRPGLSDVGSIYFSLGDFSTTPPSSRIVNSGDNGAVYGGFFNPQNYIVTYIYGADLKAIKGKFYDVQANTFSGATTITIALKYDSLVYNLLVSMQRVDGSFYGLMQQLEMSGGTQKFRYFTFKFSEAGLITNEIETAEGSIITAGSSSNVQACGVDLPNGFITVFVGVGANLYIYGIDINTLELTELANLTSIHLTRTFFNMSYSPTKCYLVRTTTNISGTTIQLDFYNLYDLTLLQTLTGNISFSYGLDYFSNEILLSESTLINSYYNISTGQKTEVYSGIFNQPNFIGSKAIVGDVYIYPLNEFPVAVPILFKYEEETLSPIILTELPAKVEISNNMAPYVVYGNSTGLAFSGISNSGILYRSWDGTSFQTRIPNFSTGIVQDSRSMHELTPSGYMSKTVYTQRNTISGYSSNLYVIENTTYSGLDSSIYTTLPGQIEYVETTNTEDYPYIFVSTSGDRFKFYQRDASSEYYGTIAGFVDRTNNLPDYPITVIRTNDFL